MPETKEKYVTEEMLDRAFVKFGQSFRLVIREDVKEIVDASIEAAIDDFAILALKHFDRLDRKIDDGFAAVDERFEKIDQRLDAMDARFDGIDHRLDRIDARFDNHLLDCVSRNEHSKLDKRVHSLELSKGRLALE